MVSLNNIFRDEGKRKLIMEKLRNIDEDASKVVAALIKSILKENKDDKKR